MHRFISLVLPLVLVALPVNAQEAAPETDAAAEPESSGESDTPTEPAPAPPVDVRQQEPEAPARKLLRVAVYEFEIADIDERVGAIVTDAVVDEMRKLKHTSVIGTREIRAMLDLEAEKQAIGCDDDQSCLAEIADALGADVLVIGSLAVVGEQTIFSMRRIDQRSAELAGTFTQRLTPADGEEFLAVVGPGVEKLFADVELKDGVTRGVSDEVLAVLNPPPLPPWSTVTTGSVALGLVVVGGLATAVNAFGFVLYDDVVKGATGSGAQPATLEELEGWATLTNASLFASIGLYGLGVAAGITAGVMAPFTDWAGASEWEGQE
jgi:hypothetical protein